MPQGRMYAKSCVGDCVPFSSTEADTGADFLKSYSSDVCTH